MNKLVNVLIICILLGGVMALPAYPLTPAQQQMVIKKINETASGLKSMSCTFVQTKHISLLSDKMISDGTMSYSQPSKLRWEYTSPYKYLFIFNGTKVYVGNSTKRDVIDTNTNKVFKEVARIMMNTVTGKALANTSDFAVNVEETQSQWKITLTPKKKDLRQMFSEIEMFFNKDNNMISELNIFEKNKDKTNIRFSNISTNKTLNANLFAIP